MQRILLSSEPRNANFYSTITIEDAALSQGGLRDAPNISKSRK